MLNGKCNYFFAHLTGAGEVGLLLVGRLIIKMRRYEVWWQEALFGSEHGSSGGPLDFAKTNSLIHAYSLVTLSVLDEYLGDGSKRRYTFTVILINGTSLIWGGVVWCGNGSIPVLE